MAAREHYQSSSLAEVSTQSQTEWLQLVELDFTPTNGADYVVFWSLEMTNKTSTTADAKCRVMTSGVVSAEFNQEVRGLEEYTSYTGFYRIVGDGLPKAISIGIQGERAADAIYARAANLIAIKLGPNDQYAESLPRLSVTGGTNIWTNCATISWEPAAGDYLVYGFSLTDNYSGTAPVYGRLLFDGAGSWEATTGHPEVGAGQKNLTPTHELWKRTVAVGGVTRTVSWQGRSHNSGSEVGWADNRLLILKLSDFDAVFYAEVAALLSNATTDYLTVASVTGMVAANPHLLLGSWGVSGDSTSSITDGRLLDGGAPISRSIQKSMSSASNRGQWAGHASGQNYAAGSRTWLLQIAGNGVNTSFTRPGSAIAILDLGSAAKAVSAQPGSFVEAGRAIVLRPERKLSAGRAMFAGSGLAAGLGPGRRVAAAAFSGLLSGGLAGARAARKVVSAPGSFSLGASTIGLLKWPDGVQYRLPAVTVDFAVADRPAGVRATRKVAMAAGFFVWANLEAGVARGRVVNAGLGPLTAVGGQVRWANTYVLDPGTQVFLSAGLNVALRYSGQQLWTASPIVAEQWAATADTPKVWSPAFVIRETWS